MPGSFMTDYAWIFYDKRVINSIKELGYISKDISDLVDKAKEAFVIPNEIIAGKELEIYYSPVFQACRKFQRVYALFTGISNLLFKLLQIKQQIRNKL